MGDTGIDRLEAIDWVARLVKDPKWTRTNTPGRLPKASGEDSFFAKTLATDRTMRSCLTLRPTEETGDDLAYNEILTIVELGDDLNGFSRTLHGGMAATLLDEVCGMLTAFNTQRQAERAKNTDPIIHYMTAYLNTTYKKPVPTPGVVLCTAKVERKDGRKLFIRATIEDSLGTTYTTGEALFIKPKPKL